MFLICSYFPYWTLQCHKKECQTDYNKKTHYLISFIFFLSSSAHRQPLRGVLQKGSATVLRPIKNTCKGVQVFIKVARFKSATLLKLNSFTVIFHRFWTQMQLYTLQSYFEEHIFKYFCRTSSMATSQYHFNTINREYSKF